jgi:hypothetical protein
MLLPRSAAWWPAELAPSVVIAILNWQAEGGYQSVAVLTKGVHHPTAPLLLLLST